MSAAVSALRRQLEELVPSPRGGARGVATGIAGLDALLPMGGLPKGKLTEIRGQLSAGVTTVLRQMIATVSQKGLVAYVDAGRTLGAGEFVESGTGNRGRKPNSKEMTGKLETGSGAVPPTRGSPIPDFRFPIPDNLWFIRPPRLTDAPWCVDVLLRSGAFALVVLDGAPPLSRSAGARLIRLARETGTALVVAGEAGRGSGVVGAAVRVVVGNRESEIGKRKSGKRETGNGERERGKRETGNGKRGHSAVTWPDVMTPQDITSPRVAETFPISRFPFPRPTRLVITIEKGGIRRGVEVEYAIGLEDRLCAHPEVGDRRGAQSGNGKRETGNGLADGDSGVGFIGIGAESEFGQRAGHGKRETGNGEPTPAAAAGGHKRRKARGGIPTPDSAPARFPSPESRVPTLGPASHRPRLRPRPRQAGVAGGDAGGGADGDDGDGGPRVVRGARGAAVG
jgi:hypothetical protein